MCDIRCFDSIALYRIWYIFQTNVTCSVALLITVLPRKSTITWEAVIIMLGCRHLSEYEHHFQVRLKSAAYYPWMSCSSLRDGDFRDNLHTHNSSLSTAICINVKCICLHRMKRGDTWWSTAMVLYSSSVRNLWIPVVRHSISLSTTNKHHWLSPVQGQTVRFSD